MRKKRVLLEDRHLATKLREVSEPTVPLRTLPFIPDLFGGLLGWTSWMDFLDGRTS